MKLQRRGRLRAVGLGLVAVLLAAASLALALAWTLDGRDHGLGLGPVEPGATERAADEQAWRLFVALNSPLDPVQGGADASRRLGDAGPVVWEGWANARAVFRRDGGDPGRWPGGPTAEAGADARFDGLPLEPGTPTRRIVGGVMQRVTDPIGAASHLNETRLNAASFDYIRQRRLFTVDGQLAAAREGQPVDFPLGSRHVKAQWEPVEPAQCGRYLCRRIALPDGGRRWYGLTALHIAAKDRPHWFWATFEQVDTMANSPQRAGRDRFACGRRPPDCGAAPSTIGLEGTVWQHYRLRGTMTDFVDQAGRPARLANSRLESGVMAGTASCITCHARASVGTDRGRVVRLPLFRDGDGSGGVATPHATRPRPGFTGRPQPDWFTGAAGGVRYAATDFVWTLERAQAHATPATTR